MNPKRLAFQLDNESEKYDLPEFLRDHVVGARDVGGELAQVEPPYPGYRRTLQAFQTYVELAKKYDGEHLPPPVAPKKTIRRALPRAPIRAPQPFRMISGS